MRYSILMAMMTLALLCACGGADGEEVESSSRSADSEDVSREVENDLYRMACKEVSCKQAEDVSRTTYDTQTYMGTAHSVTCRWSCVNYEGQDQNVFIDFRRFTGECFETRYISKEGADSYDCEEG